MKGSLKKLLLILIGTIIRIAIVPFSTDKFEYVKTLYPVSESILNGGLLYKSTIWNDSPIFALICTLMNAISPFQSPIVNNLFLSIPIILADIGIVLAIFYISHKIFEVSENKSLLISALYFLNPRVIGEVYIGHFDNFSIFLVILSLLIFLIHDQESSKIKLYLPIISAFILSIACLTKIYLLLLIPLVTIIVFMKSKWKTGIVYLFTCLLTIVLGILPFLIMFPNEFFNSIITNQFFNGFDQTSIWFVIAKYLQSFNITFISTAALNIIAYIVTGLILSFTIGMIFFKRKELTNKLIIQIVGLYIIAFAVFYGANLVQLYGIFIPFLLPVIFARMFENKEEKQFSILIVLELFVLGIVSIADLLYTISSIERIFPSNTGTNNHFGAISILVFFVGCVAIYWIETIKFFKSKELLKFTQFVLVGLTGTLITWGSLYLFVDKVGMPEWISYFLAYSVGIINNFAWNRLWTFRAERKRVKLELFKYIVANYVGFSGYWFVSLILAYGFGVHYFISNIIGTAASFTINYLLARFWTFNYQFYYTLTPVSEEKKPFTLILPMYNEEKVAKESTTKTVEFLRQHFDEFEVVVAEHGAVDKTPEICAKLAKEFPEVGHIHIDEVLGRGESLTNAIRKAKYDIVMFMDADLAVELEAILPGIGKVVAGVDLVYGDRYHPESKTERHLIREVISRAYNTYLRMIFRDKVADHQCGFKIFNRSLILPILEQMTDFNWFWDSEILIRSKLAGMKLEPIPVLWRENRAFNESKVHVFRDIREMGSAAIKLKKTLRREKKEKKKNKIKHD